MRRPPPAVRFLVCTVTVADDEHALTVIDWWRCKRQAGSRGNAIGASHDDETIEKVIQDACRKMRSRLESAIQQKRSH